MVFRGHVSSIFVETVIFVLEEMNRNFKKFHFHIKIIMCFHLQQLLGISVFMKSLQTSLRYFGAKLMISDCFSCVFRFLWPLPSCPGRSFLISQEVLDVFSEEMYRQQNNRLQSHLTKLSLDTSVAQSISNFYFVSNLYLQETT